MRRHEATRDDGSIDIGNNTGTRRDVTATSDDMLVLRVPPFTRHAAARVSHE